MPSVHADEPGPARAPAVEVARRGLGDPKMARPGWTTIALPDDLYQELLNFHVKPGGGGRRAESVQEYVRFWVRLGSLVDRALAANPDAATLAVALNALIDKAREDAP